MKLPYRNTIRKTKAAGMETGPYYDKEGYFLPGIKYEIKDIYFRERECGNGAYIYEVKLKKNIFTDLKNKNKDKILVLKTFEDLKEFIKLYTTKKKVLIKGIPADGTTDETVKFGYLKSKKLIKDFAGIEIKNYFKLKKELRKDDVHHPWFDTLDITCLFNSVWNPNIVQIKYFGEVKDIVKTNDSYY